MTESERQVWTEGIFIIISPLDLVNMQNEFKWVSVILHLDYNLQVDFLHQMMISMIWLNINLAKLLFIYMEKRISTASYIILVIEKFYNIYSIKTNEKMWLFLNDCCDNLSVDRKCDTEDSRYKDNVKLQIKAYNWIFVEFFDFFSWNN